MAYSIAIDAGTTGCRVLAFDDQLTVTAQAYQELTQYHPQPGWVEQDAEEIWRIVRQALRSVITQLPGPAATIGLTNQRETIVAWDRESGEPLHRAIVWQCRRTADHCANLRENGCEPLIRQRTGLLLDPYFSATKIAWLLAQNEDLRRRAEAGRICVGTVDSWLIFKLTGNHLTDPSNASRTLLYNLQTGNWDPELLALFDVPARILPELVDSDGHFGNTRASEVGETLPIRGVIGDQQAALFSHGGWDPTVVKQTYGTGLFMMRSTGSELPADSDLLRTVAWRMQGTTSYALEGAVFIGGAAIQWLRDGLRILPAAAESEAMAESLDGNDGVYFVPALSGLGAPWWDPHARGLIIGLTSGTTAAHVVRAGLESMAYQTRDLMEAMHDAPGGPPSRLRVDGGATANHFLMQFQADILGIQIERPQVLESTALGAAAAAAIAAGIWSRDSFRQACAIERSFVPQMNQPTRNALYARWRQAAQRSLGWA